MHGAPLFWSSYTDWQFFSMGDWRHTSVARMPSVQMTLTDYWERIPACRGMWARDQMKCSYHPMPIRGFPKIMMPQNVFFFFFFFSPFSLRKPVVFGCFWGTHIFGHFHTRANIRAWLEPPDERFPSTLHPQAAHSPRDTRDAGTSLDLPSSGGWCHSPWVMQKPMAFTKLEKNNGTCY